MAREFTSLDDIKSVIEKMGFKIGDVWYDGNKSRPVFVCSREGLPHGIEVWAETPKYVNGVTIKDVSARDFDMVDGIDDVTDLKHAIKKALAYMGVKESNMQCSMLKKKESLARKNEGLNKDDKETLSVLALRDGVLDKVWKVLDEAADKAATELANASDVEWEDAYVAAAKMLLGAVQKDGARRLR
jgi:HPt (histidine-containing phosphotransfer) domain-containing protein